jgi:hypothetical protein
MDITDLAQNQFVQLGRELLRVSNIYLPDHREGGGTGYVTAQLVYPLPPRTTVRSYTLDQIAAFREPTKRIVTAYERAWAA